jgi:hypothetical protein
LPTLTYQRERDDTFQLEQQGSLLTLQGRVIVPYTGDDKHVALIQHGAHMGAAKLWSDQSRKQIYLLVRLQVAAADPAAEIHQRVVGVDVGQRSLAVATDLQNHTVFFVGKEARARADHSARLRKRLPAERHSLGDATPGRDCNARETGEARAQPEQQSADRGRLSRQPDWAGLGWIGPDWAGLGWTI